MSATADDLSPSDPSTEPAPRRAVHLRLDPVHSDALDRICACEHEDASTTIRRLIRFADRALTGRESPFASSLEEAIAADARPTPLARKAG